MEEDQEGRERPDRLPTPLEFHSPSQHHRSGYPTSKGMKTDTIGRIVFELLIDHIAIRFGRTADKNDNNPNLNKILPIISLVNLMS
jgi:hypothetical protein